VDYVLNVAVAISAGVGALASAIPALLPHTLSLSLALLALLFVANLRGLRTTGLLFMAPTYLFIGSLLAVMAVGAWRAMSPEVHAVQVYARDQECDDLLRPVEGGGRCCGSCFASAAGRRSSSSTRPGTCGSAAASGAAPERPNGVVRLGARTAEV
jgi:hypothetical protein